MPSDPVLTLWYFNVWTYIQYIFSIFLQILGYNSDMACGKFQPPGIGLFKIVFIDGEINEKHAVQIYQNNCGPGPIN